jgi:hypothetical protein
MSKVILIQDDRHSELQKTEYESFREAVAELKRRATIPFHEPPNRAPCSGWRTCGREYSLREFEKTAPPWKSLRKVVVLEVSPTGVVWNPHYDAEWAASGGVSEPLGG